MKRTPFGLIVESSNYSPSPIETTTQAVITRLENEDVVTLQSVSEKQETIPFEPYKLENLLSAGINPDVKLNPLSSTRIDGYDSLVNTIPDIESIINTSENE